MAFSWFTPRVPPNLPATDLARCRFAGPEDAIRAARLDEIGAFAAMNQFGSEPAVALAALTKTFRVVRNVRPELARDEMFWVEAFKANPLLAMPEAHPDFVRNKMASQPTELAEQEVAPQVALLRSALARATHIDPTNYHSLSTLQAALRVNEPLLKLTRWVSLGPVRGATGGFFDGPA